MSKTSALLLAALLTASCSGSGGGVDWSKYPPALQTILEQDTAARNCSGLQEAFDFWSNAHDPGRGSRYSHTDLMKHIDGRLEAAGCYG